MATFRKIHTIFWSDPFIQSLSPERKYFYLYLLTNERTRQCGIYEITKKQISYDTGYNIDTVSLLLGYFIDTLKILYSEKTSEIAIKNWNKYNDSRSPQVKTLVNQELEKIKDKKLIQYIYSTDTVPIQNVQREREVEENKKENKKEITPDENLCFDIEKYLIKNQEQLNTVCAVAYKSKEDVLRVLKKYHLHNVEKGLYPKLPLQLIAGLQKWLINEKQFSNGTNNTGITESGKSTGANKLAARVAGLKPSD